MRNCYLWVLPLLMVLRFSAFRSEDLSSVGDGNGTSFFCWLLPSPLPSINDNDTFGILKKLPSPIQKPRYESDEGHSSKAVELLRNSINESMNPCGDFYEFTCGTWIANNPLPEGENEIDHYTVLSKRIKDQVYELLDDPMPSSSKAINRAKSMFRACMDYDRRKQSILMEKINDLGGLPILYGSQWDPDSFNLPHVLAKSLRAFYGRYFDLSNVLVSVAVYMDRQNASQKALFIDQSILGLGVGTIAQYRNAAKMAEYAQRIIGMVKILAADAGIDICEEKIIVEVEKVVAFEIKLANITTNNYPDITDASFKPRSFSDLTKLLPEAKEYFKDLLPLNKVSYHQYLASDPQVYISDFVHRLIPLLQKTDKRTLANYAILRYVFEWSNHHLDDRLDHKKETDNQRNSECAEGVVKAFDYATQAMFVRKYLGNDSKNAVSEMVEEIRNSFRTMLGHNTWMDPITKKRAVSKLDKVLPLIGFADFLLDDSKLDAYYDEMNFGDNDSYVSMVEKTSNFLTTKIFQSLLEPTDRTERYSYPIYYAGANFYGSFNAIRITSGMFQAPFFDKSFPSAMNYGSLGETIGHEFTHGFDYHGSQNDEQGNEKNWWEPETKANYQKQKKCIIDEYSAFVVPELNVTVNGTRTEFENMADNGGIKEAFMAYQAYLKKLGHREKPLKGMERFTSEQLFFISYAMKWCSKQTKETLRHDMQFQHAPARARANVVVSNMPEFVTAFKCAKGSPMNPAKKCQIW